MTIEATLERIAVALEKLAGNVPMPEKPVTSSSKGKTTTKTSKTAQSASNKGSKGTAGSPPATGSADGADGKSSDEAPTKEAVRDALQKLGKAKGSAAAVTVLAEFDATTVTKVKEDDRQAVIDAATAALEAK